MGAGRPPAAAAHPLTSPFAHPPVRLPQPNVTVSDSAPYYYGSTPPAGGNLFTNTSIAVSQSIAGPQQLDSLLNTEAVADSIAQGLKALSERGLQGACVRAPRLPPPAPCTPTPAVTLVRLPPSLLQTMAMSACT